MILLDFEKEILNNQKGVTVEVSDAAINEKYEKGEARIITEQGAVKLSLVKQVFNAENYQLRPKYQRRITWDSKKRSKLIESFIMNIPVPPIFVYETDFNRYQVMDGLQRITAIMDFYKFIKEDGSKSTKVYPYNMHGSLMRSSNGNRNLQAVQTITMPEEIVEVRIKPKSKTTIEIYFDQWIISMRLHNADTKITRTSLKFDVQIKAQPRKVMGTILPWNN